MVFACTYVVLVPIGGSVSSRLVYGMCGSYVQGRGKGEGGSGWEHKPVKRTTAAAGPGFVPAVCPSHLDSGGSSLTPVGGGGGGGGGGAGGGGGGR